MSSQFYYCNMPGYCGGDRFERLPCTALNFNVTRDGFGDTSVLGDTRWGGAFGVEATFIAMDTVTVSYIYTKGH